MVTTGAKCVFDDCPNTRHGTHRICEAHYTRIRRGTATMPEPPRAADIRWQVDAACNGVDPELWFPVSERYTDPSVAAARKVCAGCTVREQCLEWALTELSHGIAGGLTSDERRQLRAERAVAGQFESVGGAR